MAFGMQDYEHQIAARKESLFAELFQSQIHNLLEVGLGTGPNLKYYVAQKVSILCEGAQTALAVSHYLETQQAK